MSCCRATDLTLEQKEKRRKKLKCSLAMENEFVGSSRGEFMMNNLILCFTLPNQCGMCDSA